MIPHDGTRRGIASGWIRRREPEADYPEDWQEQGWCCRECGALAWYSMSPELRRELAPKVTP